jgi:FkbM family methyltransferase
MAALRKLRFFLYRRVAGAGLLAARLKKGETEIWLSDKFQVASFQDVFMDPNYWRAFTTFEQSPKLIVDCGAHCGHFAILTDLCIKARFGTSNARYILIEPNDALLPALKRNIADAGIGERATVIRGFVGTKSGTAELSTHPQNYLIGHATEGGSGEQIPYVDLDTLTGGTDIDLLKLDIEGAEFKFASANQDVLSRCRHVVAEVHSHAGSFEQFQALLGTAALHVDGPVMSGNDNDMAWFKHA